MKTMKKIEQIITPPTPHMVGDGFRVHGFLPSNDIGTFRTNPFVLLDYFSKYEFPPSDTPKGVGPHPHRGFETVTFVYHGKIAHHDSAGNSGVIGEGDVQWMTAGSGILHKEYHEKEFSKKGGVAQGVQLWVNLPSKNKMSPPKYQPLLHSDMGKLYLEDKAGIINVIAGNYKETKGPASTFTPMFVYDIRLNQGTIFEASFPEHYNTCAIIIEGDVHMNDETVPEDHLALFQNTGTDITLKASLKSAILLLSGEPIDEPIVQFGPFVMNTHKEIDQAVDDFNNGRFGYLED